MWSLLDIDIRVLISVALPVEANNDENGQEPKFSLVTGQYRKAKRFGSVAPPVSGETSSALVPHNNEGTVSVLESSAAGT